MGIRDSIFGVFRSDASDADAAAMEVVRRAMLRVMDEHSDQEHRGLDGKICNAKDLVALWYLRPELMRAIAESKGEVAARRCLAGIADLYQDRKLAGATSRLPVIGPRL